MQRLASKMSRPLEITIVGAGVAGLRCADVLLQHGCKVTIFEARDRIGGRVAQSKQLGHLVDLGPNWIHGAKNNAIRRLAIKTNTLIDPWDQGEALIDPSGTHIPAAESEQYQSLIWSDEALIDPSGSLIPTAESEEYQALLWEAGLIDRAAKYSKKNKDSIDPNRSLYDFFEEEVESLFTELPAEEAKRKRAMLLLVSRGWGSFVGSEIQRQSLRSFWLEEWVDGENVFVAETYSKILREVAKGAVEQADIKLNRRVVKVRSGEGRPSVRTASGDMECDEVVVTTPLGWLKRNHHDVFEPPMPERLSQAIDNIGYGTLDKVYITFPSAFWDVRPATNATVPNGIDHSVSASVEPAFHDEEYHWPGFTQWLCPSYAKDSNPHGWEAQAMNLAAVRSGCAHPTLLFYTYGPCSVHIAKIASDAKSDAERHAKLVEYFRPYYSLLPNFDPKSPECVPKAVLATAWANDELAGYGSYSNFQIGLENAGEDIEMMRHGMPERNVWLAGEHTAPFESVATTTGAYESGEAVAMRIVEAHGLKERER